MFRFERFITAHHPGLPATTPAKAGVGKVVVTKGNAPLATSPNWAPAFAGVVLVGYDEMEGKSAPPIIDRRARDTH